MKGKRGQKKRKREEKNKKLEAETCRLRNAEEWTKRERQMDQLRKERKLDEAW